MKPRVLAVAGGGVVLVLLLIVIFRDPACEPAEECAEMTALERFSGMFSWLTVDEGAAPSQKGKAKPIPAAPAPAPPSPAKMPVLPETPVDSLGVAEQYDILKWNLVGFRSGNVDAVHSERGDPPVKGRLTLAKGGHVVLAGWAGHPAYGMRFRDVLFSLCGQVIGRAAVRGERPDVAKAVHINLNQSGWRATLATDLIPRCDAQVLQAWGVAPIGFNVFPLTGKTEIVFADRAGPPVAHYLPEAKLLTPAQNAPAKLTSIDVSATNLRLRKCGDAKCNVVGRIAKGSHQGYVLESVADWSLIQVGELVGWGYGKYLKAR
jgi:hypothetical protein